MQSHTHRLKTIFPFLHWLPKLNNQTIQADLIAGITNAIIVLPQGVAYALIAGMPPEYGLYAAIIPAIIAALFGSSYHLISGPTVAMSIVVFSSISIYAEPGSSQFIQMALTMTFLAGVFQLMLGMARLGTLVNFVSHSVVIGFTAGAAIIIATSQLKNVFGVHVPSGESFIHTWIDLIKALPETNYYTLSIAIVTFIVAFGFKKYAPKWPGMLFAMVIGGLMAYFMDAEANGIKLVGEIPASLPPLSLPDFSIQTIKQLAPGALAIAVLGLVEAVSIARAVATRSHQQIDGNQEFIGQGLSNIGGAFFSSYAASGSFTRTGVNYESGAKTPLAAIFAGISLALIVLLIAPLTAYVPIPSMAGILLLVSYGLIDFHHIKAIMVTSRSEMATLVVTFFATLFLELEFAIYAGVMLSLVIYLNRTSKPKMVVLAPDTDDISRRFTNIEKKPLPQCPQVQVERLDGSLFFGAVSYVSKKWQEVEKKHLLIMSNGINFVDVAGVETIVQEAKRRQAIGGGLYFVNMKAEARKLLEKPEYAKLISDEHIFDSKTEAVQGIFIRLDKDICRKCPHRVFHECQSIPAPE
ncbi:SulP family inorganic anion transporter [Candidatus Albibeggiatoa sp. nov. NOAA]|uniref:SulP family inorganic anion transporter n=1 Tax=Candidatus Albibeggiatoa sp. nov. NOAA TaxID=3162724 RepID=UPI0032F88093|nr:SulP family inorganic anion transporter [Thiotrichaceae bacterium]